MSAALRGHGWSRQPGGSVHARQGVRQAHGVRREAAGAGGAPVDRARAGADTERGAAHARHSVGGAPAAQHEC
eukprot:15100606-Alexandrium_andersonii.AAC.1